MQQLAHDVDRFTQVSIEFRIDARIVLREARELPLSLCDIIGEDQVVIAGSGPNMSVQGKTSYPYFASSSSAMTRGCSKLMRQLKTENLKPGTTSSVTAAPPTRGGDARVRAP